MDIRYVTGDLIASQEIIIAHGCNARGRFASGLAGEIRKRLPFAAEAYDNAGAWPLGSIIWAVSIVGGSRARFVANMITQPSYGRDPDVRYVDYDAVRSAIRALDTFVFGIQAGDISVAGMPPINSVGLPLLGCGLGNGSWETVSRVIEDESRCFEPVVYTLDGHIPTR